MILLRLWALLAIAAALPVCADGISAADEQGILGSSWTVARLSGYAFKTAADLSRVHSVAASLRARLPADDARSGDIDSFLYEIEAFADPHTGPGESVDLVDFSKSGDRALRRLRDDVRLPPPSGGAVLRKYPNRDSMPGPIRSLFGSDTAGVTHWMRYMAVLTEEKSPEEIADTVSHELVHAYLLSILGPDGGGLPRWFHEGAALYLSGGRLQYVSTSDFGRERVSYNPKDYNEFRLVFRYIAATEGPDAVHTFIRDAVLRRDVETPLFAATGVRDYEVLRQDAWGWDRRRSAWKVLAVLAASGVVIGLLSLVSRRRRARVERAMALIEEARMLARVGLRDQALENLAGARAIEPYLARVRMAIQQVEDEVHRVAR